MINKQIRLLKNVSTVICSSGELISISRPRRITFKIEIFKNNLNFRI